MRDSRFTPTSEGNISHLLAMTGEGVSFYAPVCLDFRGPEPSDRKYPPKKTEEGKLLFALPGGGVVVG